MEVTSLEGNANLPWSYVYVAEVTRDAPPQIEGLCRLSWAADHASEIQLARGMSPVGIRVIQAYRTQRAEKLGVMLQERFRDRRFRGEWFDLSLEDLDDLAESAGRWLRHHDPRAAGRRENSGSRFQGAPHTQAELTSSAYSVLCYLARENEPISYEMIQARTGIGSRSTVSNALRALREGVAGHPLIDSVSRGQHGTEHRLLPAALGTTFGEE